MKKFPHQQFIEDNGIAIDTLPKMIQKRIKGFEELQEDLEYTTEHDREQLLDKLDLLSLELEEDLEEQFEDQLENNDVEDEEPEEEVVLPLKGTEEKPEEKELTDETVEYKPELIEGMLAPEEGKDEPELEERVPAAEIVKENNDSITTVPEPQITTEAKSENDDDEDILSQLFSKDQLKISPAQLISKGFKKKLNNKMIAVGKYALYRGKYDTCYTLLLKEK